MDKIENFFQIESRNCQKNVGWRISVSFSGFHDRFLLSTVLARPAAIIHAVAGCWENHG